MYAGGGITIIGNNSLSTGFNSTCTLSYTKIAWYKFEAQLNIPLNISTCAPRTNFVARLALFSNCSSTTCIPVVSYPSCNVNDFFTTILFTPTDSSIPYYYLAVYGDGTEEGTYELKMVAFNYTSEVYCNYAQSVDVYHYSPLTVFYGDTTYHSPLYDATCGNIQGFHTYWFKLTAEESNPVSFYTCSTFTNFNTRLLFYYAASTCGNLNCLHTNAFSCPPNLTGTYSLVTLLAGYEIYVVVTGETAQDYGQFELTIEKY